MSSHALQERSSLLGVLARDLSWLGMLHSIFLIRDVVGKIRGREEMHQVKNGMAHRGSRSVCLTNETS